MVEKINIPILDNEIEMKKFAKNYAIKKSILICSIFFVLMIIAFIIGYSMYEGDDYFERANPAVSFIMFILLCLLAYSHLYNKAKLVPSYHKKLILVNDRIIIDSTERLNYLYEDIIYFKKDKYSFTIKFKGDKIIIPICCVKNDDYIKLEKALASKNVEIR